MVSPPTNANHPSLQVVLSFAHGQAVQAQGAACILCPCDALAEKLRNIRSSYGMRKAVPVVKTANGRMSEAQAAFGLLALQTLALPPAKRQQP
ncbi:MAG: hypothetical protein HC848_00610 [Limnobacter sp.]|nr:hypothetical protein [Limnobacter sp.]